MVDLPGVRDCLLVLGDTALALQFTRGPVRLTPHGWPQFAMLTGNGSCSFGFVIKHEV